MFKLLVQVMENRPHDKYKVESNIWYETARFSMVNKDYKSNFLEVLELVDRRADEVSQNECLFVLWEPRAFKLYNRFIFFFGAVDNKKEQEFLSKTKGSLFFDECWVFGLYVATLVFC